MNTLRSSKLISSLDLYLYFNRLGIVQSVGLLNFPVEV